MKVLLMNSGKRKKRRTGDRLGEHKRGAGFSLNAKDVLRRFFRNIY
jgi:hypothetical protein